MLNFCEVFSGCSLIAAYINKIKAPAQTCISISEKGIRITADMKSEKLSLTQNKCYVVKDLLLPEYRRKVVKAVSKKKYKIPAQKKHFFTWKIADVDLLTPSLVSWLS